MHRMWLRLQAPFAAFRYFQAGVYRSTAPTIPHSAAWGLVLNLAGVEIRSHLNNPITEINPSAPKLRIAVGAINHGENSRLSEQKNTLYQQLHTYPVGSSGKENALRAKGGKYWIAPAKREFLTDFDAMLGVETEDASLLDKVRMGIEGTLPVERYGLPFAGDNNLLFDQIQILGEPKPAHWYCPVEGHEPCRGSCRLTIKIDRVDSSKSHSLLFAPEPTESEHPPNSAWIWTPEAPLPS